MQDHYQAVIQKTLDYIRSNLAEPLSLEVIAKTMGYSKSRLGRIFKKGTGKGIVSQLIDLRIGKAKELLGRTNLSVSEIAAEVGFNSHTSFDIAFFKKMQISPTEFRRRSKAAGPGAQGAGFGIAESRLWFSDSMAKGLRHDWLPIQGTWTAEQGCIVGQDEETFRLQFAKLLPENFRLQFEVRLMKAYGSPASTVEVALEDQAHGRAWYVLSVGGHVNILGTLARKDVALIRNREAVIREGQWHRIIITLNDDLLSLVQDGVERFHYRDPFPVPYANRCGFSLRGWRSVMQLRNVAIEDLGFLPMALAVRRGDALFNSGLYEQARQLYLRMGETESAPADISELQYKIGMCHLYERNYEQARLWAEKAALLPAGVFWSQQASLAIMDADYQEGRIDDFLAKLISLFSRPPMRDPLREKVLAANQDLLRRGFGNMALILAAQWLELEKHDLFYYGQVLVTMIETLHFLNRFEQERVFQRELTASLDHLPENKVFALFSVVDTCNCLGLADEARKALAEIRSTTRNFANLARSDVYESLCLRVEARFEEAVSLLQGVASKYPRAEPICRFADLVMSTLLVSLGKIDKAKGVLLRAGQGSNAEYGYPPWFAEGDLRKAAELLLEDRQYGDEKPAFRAGQLVRAGILFELAGDKTKSREIWEQTVRKYPLSYCAYYENLARFLLGKGPDCFDAMPFPVRARSEMFFLAGLLMETRGHLNRSRSLLRQSADEDLMNHWPAVLARKKLRSSAP